eukprot:COSAG02_NODE_89_length_38500_cov_61.646910_10_plen_197_part_00
MHAVISPVSLSAVTHFQKITFSILVSGVTPIQGLSAISFTIHIYTHKLTCGVLARRLLTSSDLRMRASAAASPLKWLRKTAYLPRTNQVHHTRYQLARPAFRPSPLLAAMHAQIARSHLCANTSQRPCHTHTRQPTHPRTWCLKQCPGCEYRVLRHLCNAFLVKEYATLKGYCGYQLLVAVPLGSQECAPALRSLC